MAHFGWINRTSGDGAVPRLGLRRLPDAPVHLGAVPNELIDAARVDGCHTLRVFWHVILPAVRPIAAVLGLLTFMNTWNDFFWPLIVLTPHNPTVQVAVSTRRGAQYVPDYSLILTGVHLDPAAARRLPRPRQADRGRDHEGGGQGTFRTSRGAPRRPRSRSRAQPRPTAAASRSGTASPARRGRCRTATPATPPASTTTAGGRISI